MDFKDYKEECDNRIKKITGDKAKSFLADLKLVYEKHGLILNGCGCCGSPFIDFPDPTKELRLEAYYGGYSVVQVIKE